MKRWSNLKFAKPQKLKAIRAKSASRKTLDKYYKEIGTILTNHNLKNKPQNIYHIDDTGVSTEHNPPKVVCNTNSKPQNITSPRSSNVAIIAAGNVLGNSGPPYYVFPGQRWNPDFLSGACPDADGEMSKKGWSNSQVFQNYVPKHFATFVKLSDDKTSDHTLILYDGHKSHISLTFSDWARKQCHTICTTSSFQPCKPTFGCHSVRSIQSYLQLGVSSTYEEIFRSKYHQLSNSSLDH